MRKRIISICLLLTLVMSLFGSICIPAAAATLSVPNDALLVDPAWTESTVPATITYGGKSFTLTWGSNAYSDAQTALDAASAGGTVILLAGTYDAELVVKKDLTILGAKAGIDPNVRGAKATDGWTLSNQRGTGETVITNAFQLGINEKVVYDTDFTVTLDGIMLTGNGQLRSNSGTEGKGNLILKNLYIKDSAVSNNPNGVATPLFLQSYHYEGAGNLYQRSVTIANARFENQDTDAIRMTADSADISGVYVDENSTCIFLPNASASAASKAAVNWNIHDCMFRNTVARSMYFNWDSTQVKINSVYLNSTLGERIKVTTTIRDCVFLDSFEASGSYTVAFRPNLDNIYYVFEDNIFYHTKAPASKHNPITGYATTTLDYSDQITVKNNKFIGKFGGHWSFNNAGGYVDISGNYYEDENGQVAPLKSTSVLVEQDWWWTDSAMTQKAYAEQPTPSASAPKLDLEKDVKWLGRTYTEGGKHYFTWSSSGFEFNFYGTEAYATLHYTNNYSSSIWKHATAYLWVYVDGEKTQVIQLTDAAQNVCLAEGLTEGNHTIKVVKRVNGRSNKAAVSQIWLNEGGSADLPNAVAGRKIQFVGDSITVGYGAIQPIKESTWTVNTEDSTVTYAYRTAEYFGAENHTVAISGRGVLYNTGGDKDTANHAPLMYNYNDWTLKGQWDHSLYQPDVVVINLGTNDNSSCPTDGDKNDFKIATKAFIQQVRGVNPNAHIIWAFGAMGDKNGLRYYIEAAISELKAAGDNKIYYIHLPEGEEFLGHPTAATHITIGDALIAKVAEVTGWTEHTSHSYNTTTHVASDCKNHGIAKHTCTVCGDVYTSELPLSTEHTPSTTVIPVTPASCGEPGMGYKECTVCGKVAVENVVIPATNNHTPKDELEVITPPTCGDPGVGKSVCKDCPYVIDDNVPIPATGNHTVTKDPIVDQTPSCNAPGTAHTVCDVCGKIAEENIPVPSTGAHAPADELVIDQKATCTKEGVGHSVCKGCGITMEENIVIPMNEDHAEAADLVIEVEATCMTTGLAHSVCRDCGDILRENIVVRATGHVASDYVIPYDGQDATCAEDGLGYQVCIYCPVRMVEKVVIPATGHTPDEWQTVEKPTLLKTGLKICTCLICTEVVDSEVIPVLRGEDVLYAFDDVKKTDWYYKNGALNYVYNAGLLKGVGDGKIAPKALVERGMFVTILGRLHGVEVDNKVETVFTDVASGKYYTGYVKWASDNKIVNGLTDTTFGPAAKITREQICTMMVRYCNYADVELKSLNKAVTFKDAADISKFAKTAVAACQVGGIVNGIENDNSTYSFNPKGDATRAEVATILMNFVKNYK